MTKATEIEKARNKVYPNARKVRCVEDNLTFDTVNECSKYYGVSASAISQVCNKRFRVKGKTIEYV